MNVIIEFIVNTFNAWVESGLAKDTADACGAIITYTANVLIPLMWDYINVIFGGAA